jgi:arylsulfatase A-like enzyme
VLTSDHGEIVGEDGRWGHSYHMFPQVSQVPLLVHVPAATRTMRPDVGALALSTDITPTVYDVLGYTPAPPDALRGRSLIRANQEASPDRRRDSYVLAASYGAVYAVVSRNGRRLYIADAVQERDYAYERSSPDDLRWTEVKVDEGTRALGQLRIRRHVDTVAHTYGLDRPF